MNLTPEQALLEKIFLLIKSNDSRTVVPIGDDGFAFKSFSQNTVLVQDMSIEGVHFRRDWSSPFEIGHKSLSVNLSDLAAMGATPKYAQISLAVPKGTRDEEVLEFYEGLTHLAKSNGLSIVGGDLCQSPSPWIIDISCVGEAATPITRKGIKAGDRLYVSGPLGLARLGFDVLQGHDLKINSDLKAQALKSFKTPNPRLDLLPLLQLGRVKACIDVSDGLANELSILCRQNNLGFTLEPFDKNQEPSLERILFGGEDYELLMATEPDVLLKDFLQIGVFDDSLKLKFTDGTPINDQQGLSWSHF